MKKKVYNGPKLEKKGNFMNLTTGTGTVENGDAIFPGSYPER